MTALTLAIPDSALSALRRSPPEFGREVKLTAAIHWYGRGLMSQDRAAELAGMNRRDFIPALAREGIDVFSSLMTTVSPWHACVGRCAPWTMGKAPEVEASAGLVGRQADRQVAAKPNARPIRLPAAPAVTT